MASSLDVPLTSLGTAKLALEPKLESKPARLSGIVIAKRLRNLKNEKPSLRKDLQGARRGGQKKWKTFKWKTIFIRVREAESKRFEFTESKSGSIRRYTTAASKTETFNLQRNLIENLLKILLENLLKTPWNPLENPQNTVAVGCSIGAAQKLERRIPKGACGLRLKNHESRSKSLGRCEVPALDSKV